MALFDLMTSTKTTTTTMTTPAKLYGKDLSVYDDIDVDELLNKLTPEEISVLAKEVDPDWIPPPPPAREQEAEEQIAVDLGDEYEQALSSATQDEIIDLAAILGFHSMMNQDQYHASLLNKGQPVGLGWDGITKASKPKLFPIDPPNSTDPDETVKKVQDDETKFIDLNWNNIKSISDEKFDSLFEALANNTHLETLSLANSGLTDKHVEKLAQALEKNETLKRSQVLGNKIEMEITQLIEKNPTILRLGLHLEYNDARHRIATHLQRNIDTSKCEPKNNARSERNGKINSKNYRNRIKATLIERRQIEEDTPPPSDDDNFVPQSRRKLGIRKSVGSRASERIDVIE
ncbi:hypothetical protein NQ314_009984 [Rhamnusium bicolor]|uniref:Tropomodulin n=1 Tax=Rhamnusium bicolor TaxID=1586634 RepID=A0AAV8XY20_9CUCU|nr:hypothetical protein NQ314_009984 [Rhamnusium bicolor]